MPIDDSDGQAISNGHAIFDGRPISNGHSFANGHAGPNGLSKMPRRVRGPEPLTRKVKRRDELSIIIGPIFVLLLDLAVPCIIYYVTLRSYPGTPVFEQGSLGYTIISFGIGELGILIVRVYRLFRRPQRYAPLLSKSRWELDATAWVYGTALLVALIPFVVSTSIDNKEPWLFLYAPAFLIAYLWICAIVTLVPFKVPVRIDSEPAGSRLYPLVYYAAEDFMAVDAVQGREFRVRYRARYRESPMFRQMIRDLNLFWIGGCTVYLGCVSAVVWNLSFEFAFGVTLGVLFFWVILWAFLTWVWVQLALIREARWYRKRSIKSRLEG